MIEVGISFYVEGSMEQKIVLTDESYTPESLVEGLKDGTIFTTISYSYDEKVGMVKKVNLITNEVVDINADNPFKQIGYISEQSGMDDLQISDYELFE